jgi:hypothetical protein
MGELFIQERRKHSYKYVHKWMALSLIERLHSKTIPQLCNIVFATDTVHVKSTSPV